MRRPLAISIALLLAAPGAAAAAPLPRADGSSPLRWGELPFQPVKSSAVCLAPTGVRGELVRWTPAGAELLDATAAGLVPKATIALGTLETCPDAAVDASGAGVIAGATKHGVKVAVRDPGGDWGAPATFASGFSSGVAVAVSA